MLRQSVLIVLAISAASAWALRDHPGAEPAAEPATQAKRFHSSPNPWSKDEVHQARAGGEWYGEVRLERSFDGHFYSYATIDHARIRVVVDTGASVVALTGDDARAAGLEWDDSEIAVVARGASGDVHGVRRRIPWLDVGGIVVRDVDAIVIPRGLDVSLLGQSFLGQMTSVEMRGGNMVLSNM